ncbi:ANTH-domain-containing protein [Rhodofomes roseus]|uniref:ANTH-domain-containing protein n=1 Tax=Rhodofomes roseus TaxID=34475 RepID=A0ABQ8KP48_9APHY|nr:ANTH-domain-containing protein [Rhodofomes roseus]KAH9839938.1 ANTH-domain-containing protein [Rhodofomes roseus]
MTSFEKAVKGACKPKPNPPKAKYLDPILAATWSEEGAVHDVCRALIPRFREPNTIVVFKALIVLHMMIRNGSTDNVLSYLSSSDVLKLKSISSMNWEGYNAPPNLLNYATYLDTRIRAYAQLKHDAIRVQSETNRDMRNSAAVEEELGSRRGRSRAREPPKLSVGVQRSKTLTGRKLRVMTVEKGLLRETKIVQKMIDALLECRFYLDDLDNELNITALRMLVKDLLILFQACNEGVINVLEHYFEMFRTDAEEALNLYRHFCKETERVVEYLGVAKKLQNILNVPIPNLRHAPVSLAGALEEYLRDPNFEQNRIEYKANKEAAERAERTGTAPPMPKSKPPEKAPEAKPSTSNDSSEAQSPGSKAPQDMIDFFSAIENEQENMFNPQTNSPSTAYFQQNALHNPFAQQQMQMMTGAPPFGGAQPFGQPQMQPQPTGFIMPQYTSTNPFGMLQQQQQQPPQQQPAPFLQPQHTSFLQPQATGVNPFRQSMMLPQMTGMAAFGQQQHTTSTNPFPVQNTGQPFAGGSTMPQFGNAFSSQIAAPSAQQPNANSTNTGPARPMSAPLTAIPPAFSSSTSPPPAQPVKTHQTGSRNPFGIPVSTPPPMPKPPTLFELAMGPSQQNQQNGQQQQTSPTSSGFGSNGFGSQLSSQPTGSVMANVASSFTFNKPGENSSSTAFSLNPQQTASTTTGSTFSDSLFSSSMSSQPTGATVTSSAPSISVSHANPLQPQKTGFNSGLKAFKPSSSFGAALLESLPPIPQSAPTTPGETPQTNSPFPTQNGNANQGQSGSTSGLGTQPTGFSSGLGGLNSQPTGAFGSSLTGLGSQPTGALNSQPTGAFGALGKSPGSGLRPQMTGTAGGANPFRASMFPMTTGLSGGNFGSANGAGPTPSFLGSSPTGVGNSQFGMSSSSSAPSFGNTQFGLGQDASKLQQQQQQQQQNGSASLI